MSKIVLKATWPSILAEPLGPTSKVLPRAFLGRPSDVMDPYLNLLRCNVKMGGMEANLDVLEAFPTLPHFSHLYPESRVSLLVNLSRASEIAARGVYTLLGEVDLELDPRNDDPLLLLAGGAAFLMGRMSNPISSIGSILQETARQAEHVTLDSTVPLNRRKGYSVSSS